MEKWMITNESDMAKTERTAGEGLWSSPLSILTDGLLSHPQQHFLSYTCKQHHKHTCMGWRSREMDSERVLFLSLSGLYFPAPNVCCLKLFEKVLHIKIANFYFFTFSISKTEIIIK